MGLIQKFAILMGKLPMIWLNQLQNQCYLVFFFFFIIVNITIIISLLYKKFYFNQIHFIFLYYIYLFYTPCLYFLNMLLLFLLIIKWFAEHIFCNLYSLFLNNVKKLLIFISQYDLR